MNFSINKNENTISYNTKGTHHRRRFISNRKIWSFETHQLFCDPLDLRPLIGHSTSNLATNLTKTVHYACHYMKYKNHPTSASITGVDPNLKFMVPYRAIKLYFLQALSVN